MLLANASALAWADPIGTERFDVRLDGERIAEVGIGLERRAGESVFDLEGKRLAPGLHDHHVHLRALAALESSVIVGPPEIQSLSELSERLEAAEAHMLTGQWLRGVAYHESVAGELDRRVLDALVPDRPVRIQHATGMLWMLNSRALEALGIGQDAPPGAERDGRGELNGRFWREDAWLAERLPKASHDFSALSQLAASRGITGFTDATPGAGDAEVAAFLEANHDAVLLQRLCVMAEPGTASPDSPMVSLGPVKVLLDDADLPDFDALVDRFRSAHEAGRPAAVHCVTRTTAVLAVAAFEAAGVLAGDRIEHGSIMGPDLLEAIARLGLWVVTQPGLLVTRGDRWLADVPARAHRDLWRLGSLLAAGITTAGSTDAPFGSADVWVAIGAAHDRRTLKGAVLGPDEAVAPSAALALFTSDPHDLGRQRTVAPGELADLVVVEPGTAGYADAPTPLVKATFVGGRLVYATP
jgi:predicted amidohydrolase YtcJ